MTDVQAGWVLLIVSGLAWIVWGISRAVTDYPYWRADRRRQRAACMRPNVRVRR